MVQTIEIENYKSVQNLRLDLGCINVLIGENGCGKSNILEAIALGSAAAADKLDNEFLFSRGIRITDSKLMTSAFEKENADKEIILRFFYDKENTFSYYLENKQGNWRKNNKSYNLAKDKNLNKEFREHFLKKGLDTNMPLTAVFEGIPADMFLNYAEGLNLDEETLQKLKEKINDKLEKAKDEITTWQKVSQEIVNTPLLSFQKRVSDFLFYAPENHFLRRFEEEGQIQPLGTKGEGLFKHLVDIQKDKPALFALIQENLSFIDWFESFEIPDDLFFGERKIQIQDRFLTEGWLHFDQRSANEGFLFLLFYLTLFSSDKTPPFFAIDNIDTAFNPKLCSKVIQILAELAQKQNKQVILTTHNPAILDGLNLDDDMQRLFVVYRNGDGHTKTRRIMKPETPAGVEPIRLSEAFLRGAIGGLPKTF